MTSRHSDTPKSRTGARAASKSTRGGKVLSNPRSRLAAKSVAASALTQAKGDRLGAKQGSTPASKTLQKKQGAWLLQDAKARFSELVRRVKDEGPQQVSVHGKIEVVVVSAHEFRRLKGDQTGAALVAAMQAAPGRAVEIAPARTPMPVRTIEL